jgi:hypothetical protein
MKKTGSAPDEPPGDLRRMEDLLRRIRFVPRSSFGPELLGRITRHEQPTLVSRPVLRSWWPAGLAAGLALALVFFLSAPRTVTLDRCCYDLDGGGAGDDGALIVAERDGKVHRLSVYEDRDGSGTFTPADLVRLTRVGTPIREEAIPAGLTTIRHCCVDFDGGGPADDGLLVVATPPDRVHTAAIYELR